MCLVLSIYTLLFFYGIMNVGRVFLTCAVGLHKEVRFIGETMV